MGNMGLDVNIFRKSDDNDDEFRAQVVNLACGAAASIGVR